MLFIIENLIIIIFCFIIINSSLSCLLLFIAVLSQLQGEQKLRYTKISVKYPNFTVFFGPVSDSHMLFCEASAKKKMKKRLSKMPENGKKCIHVGKY